VYIAEVNAQVSEYEHEVWFATLWHESAGSDITARAVYNNSILFAITYCTTFYLGLRYVTLRAYLSRRLYTASILCPQYNFQLHGAKGTNILLHGRRYIERALIAAFGH